MAMRYCKDCYLYECCMRTPLGGCQEFDNVAPQLKPPITPEDVRKYMSEQVDGYWEKFRREAAIDLMPIARQMDTEGYPSSIVKMSIQLADELIKQLKEK